MRRRRHPELWWGRTLDSLPAPDVLATEIVENLEAALEQFRSVSTELASESE
ncbi:hypothetical protein [Guyparkeria sp.]|uniref:hypothetical protein n=1 Tax=Guyparkeria sp. TaxID=2035736 RepID=UPI003970C494